MRFVLRMAKPMWARLSNHSIVGRQLISNQLEAAHIESLKKSHQGLSWKKDQISGKLIWSRVV